MTKKEIINQLEKMGKIDSFKNLTLLKDYLNIYCYEDFKSIKEMKKALQGYLFKYCNSYYYCYYDNIANYIDGEKYNVNYDGDNLPYVNYNGIQLYL